MTWSVKKVRRALRRLQLKPLAKRTATSHEFWGNDNGRRVQLARKGSIVPHLFLHILAGQIQNHGICSAREFKQLMRSE